MGPRALRDLALIGCLALATAAAATAADYIGAAKCKLCHKLQFESWQGQRHATAFQSLKPEEQAKPECLRCHATAERADLPGVQCEACHGAGSEYKVMSVMKDREASLAAGLVIPDEARCKSCHEKAPHDVPAFVYATALGQGVHAKKN